METEKLQQFAELLQKEHKSLYLRRFPGSPFADDHCKVSIRPGKKYTKVDVGSSGKYMVVNDTGEIFGIKSYGVIHRGHYYGTLDEIDKWNWGDYQAYPKSSTVKHITLTT